MSQANELLDAMTDEDIAAYVANAEAEPHIVVGSDRYIKVPDELKRIAVEHDHNVETVTFDCPRYWDEHDLSTMKVYINYLLPDNTPGSYIADNVRAEDDIMHFDWTITNNVTHTKGNISFLICIKNVDAEGNESNHWNSELNRDLYISEGLETEVTVLNNYPDIVTQLLTRMDSVEAVKPLVDAAVVTIEEAKAEAIRAAEEANQAKIAAEEARTATTDIQTSVNQRADEVSDSYANALKGHSAGEIIRVDDVSPVEHNVKCQVNSKNLIDLDRCTFTRCTREGYTITSNITGSFYAKVQINYLGDYLLKHRGESITFSVANANNRKIDIVIFGTYTGSEDTYRSKTSSFDYESYVTLVIPEDLVSVDRIELRFNHSPDSYTDIETVFEDFQLELNETATEYTPYIDPSTVTVTRCGKNILPNPYYDKSEYVTGGITYTVQDDGGIRAVGTATANSYFRMMNRDLSNLSYTLTDCVHDTANKFTYVWVKKGETVDKVFYPQVEIGTVATEYEKPVVQTTYTPGTDGAVTVKSVSPTMTLLTDTAGVTIECEYNIDINTVFDKINTLLEMLVNGVE